MIHGLQDVKNGSIIGYTMLYMAYKLYTWLIRYMLLTFIKYL